jgi:hypothetical protein
MHSSVSTQTVAIADSFRSCGHTLRQIDSTTLQHMIKLSSRSCGRALWGASAESRVGLEAAILNRRRRNKGRFMETDQERAERHERERIESNERYETERKESGARAEQERKDAREIREHPEDHRSD